MSIMDFLNTQAVPLILVLVMVGLGLGLTMADFKRIFKFPKPVAIGVVSQFIGLPLLAFALGYIFSPAASLAVGLVILASAPSGVTSNAYSFAAKGDLAISVTLTAIASVVTVFTIPLLTFLALLTFMEKGAAVPELPYLSMMQRLVLMTIVPIIVGMSIRAFWPKFAERLVERLRPITVAVLILVILSAAVSSYEVLLEQALSALLLVTLLNLLSMALGYGAARLFNLPMSQRVTLTFEVGVQNLALVLVITLTVLQQPPLAVATLLYAVVMPVTAMAFVWLGRRLIAGDVVSFDTNSETISEKSALHGDANLGVDYGNE